MRYNLLLIPFYPLERGKQAFFWMFLFAAYAASIIVATCPEPFGIKCSLARCLWLPQFAMLMYTLECCRTIKAKKFMLPAILWAISLSFAVGSTATPEAYYMSLARILIFLGVYGLRRSLRHRLREYPLFNLASTLSMLLLAAYIVVVLVWPGRLLLGVILMFFVSILWTASINLLTEVNKRYLPNANG